MADQKCPVSGLPRLSERSVGGTHRSIRRSVSDRISSWRAYAFQAAVAKARELGWIV